MSDELIKRLGMAQIGACSCMTKSPDLEWHDESCKYRLFCEAADLIEQQAAKIAELSTCKLCNSTGHDTPCAYPTEINRQQAKRIAALESASKDAMRREAFEEAIRVTAQAQTTSHACDAIRALSQKVGDQK